MFEDIVEQAEQSNSAPGSENTGTESAPEQSEVLDLDSVDKFKFQGKEWTPKDLQSAYLMQSDYTQKTQALAEERKYISNLSIDLEKVAADPALASKFMEIYPKQYHGYLKYVLKKEQAKQESQAQQSEKPPVDSEFVRRFETLEKQIHEREVQAADRELEATFKVMRDKYPYADEEAVVARALHLNNQGEQLTADVWDKLWKGAHDRVKGLTEKAQSQGIQKQKELNQQGKDVASGGGIPSQAPKRPKTIREAAEQAVANINS